MNTILTILAICSVETNLKNVDNMNDGGSPSYGICQIKMTAAKQVLKNVEAHELQKVRKNIKVAHSFFKWQTTRYTSEYCQISAYNAGHCTTKNRGYVEKVRRRRQQIKKELTSAEGKLFSRIIRLKLPKKFKHHLKNAIRLETGDKGKDF